MRHPAEYDIAPELRAKVLRCYTEKNMSLDIISKLSCPRRVAYQILAEAGIPLKTRGQGMREDPRFEYRVRHPSFEKKYQPEQS